MIHTVSVRASLGFHQGGTKFYAAFLIMHVVNKKSYVIKVYGANNSRGRVIVEPYPTLTGGERSYGSIYKEKSKPGEYVFETLVNGVSFDALDSYRDIENLVKNVLIKHQYSKIQEYTQELMTAIYHVSIMEMPTDDVKGKPASKSTPKKVKPEPARDISWGSW